MTDRTELRRSGRGPNGPGPLAETLDLTNEQFHEAYDGAKTEAKYEWPVFVLLADSLVVFHRGVRSELHVTPEAFHMLKAIAHVPVALYAELQRSDAEERRTRLERLQQLVQETQQRLSDRETLSLSEEVTRDVTKTLERSAAVLERLLAGDFSDAPDGFAGDLGPVLLRLIHEATRRQLASLHEAVERALEPMSERERAELHVVVAGDHQARSRSLGMQYFKRRLGEPEHTEERVAYAEGVSDEQEAFELVGTRRLDYAVAAAFFGDRKRLQRDILGDSAEEILRKQSFDPIA